MFKNYRKKDVQPMRPYVLGEDMTGICVNKEDTPELGGMIAVNPANGEDRWKAAPSDKMFDQMLKDYKKSLNAARATLNP
jgi:hypothetical protein